MGGIDGKTYTNSREAFQHNYDLGHRVFEVDFSLVYPENTLVAAHDEAHWRTLIDSDASPSSDLPFDYPTFMRTKVYNSYTPLDYEDIIDLMIMYPDIYIITDTKCTDHASVYLQFSQLVRCAKEKAPAVLNRIIPQIYHEEMLDWIMDTYMFKSVIFTLYQTDWTSESVLEFCQKTNVDFVTVDHTLLTEEMIQLWTGQGIYIGVHTVNDLERAQNLANTGINGIYTDFLTPSQIE